jgi:predicted nucleotidyltransferase
MLPEKIRKTLEKTVKQMRVQENAYGIGLFGSWSRGEADASSDIDLLILDRDNINHEYVQRIEAGGLLIDLDHVPKRWISSAIPPEVDQKLYEMQILYDRDWSLANTKFLIAKSYGSPERVDIRTEAHIIDSDIYLSRATSAFSREDFLSAYLFATVALEHTLKIFIEVALEPFSNSRFIERLQSSTTKLGMQDMFNQYLDITSLNEIDTAIAKEKLKLFKEISEEISTTVRQNPHVFEACHLKVKTKLKYYLSPAFLEGALIRTNSLIESQKVIEASHYLNDIFLEIIENYAWLRSSIGVKIDYTTLILSLESLEGISKNYETIMTFLNLINIDKLAASRTIDKIRETMRNIRRQRKTLIRNFIKTYDH